MATGGEWRQSIDISSDIVYDFSCTLCWSDGKNIDALFYCVECVERFCSACLLNQNKYARMKTHTILDKAKMVAMGPQPVYTLPTERCLDHHGNLIDTYCPEHREVCCSTCVSLDHRSCKGITYIPIAAKNVTDSKEYTDIRPLIKSIQRRLETMKKTMHDDLDKHNREKAEALKQIADFRKFIDSEMDRMEQYVTNDLQSRHTLIEKDIKSNIKSLEDLISTLEASQEKLEQMNTNNESEIFVQLKFGEKRKSDGESLLQHLEVCPVRGTLAFFKNEELKDFIANIDKIGKITENIHTSSSRMNVTKIDGKEQKTKQEKYATPSVISYDKDQKTTQLQQATPSVMPDSATLFGEYNLLLSGEVSPCDIYDCCQLQDGTFIVSDSNNNKLKRINSSFQIISSCMMTGGPGGVCVTGNMEVAVTLDLDKEVQFLSVGGKLQQIRSFPTHMECLGCTFSNDCLWVVSRSKIAMFSKTGQLLKETKLNQPFTLYSYSSVTCNTNNTNTYFSNKSNKVIVLDRKGDKIGSITDPELKGATKICVLDNDDILVCCYDSNKVLRFSSEGRKLGVLLQKADGLNKPQSICLDRINSRLIVTRGYSDKIKVYNLR